ncbi:hypothetical protein LguiB_035039 [Lonicera macranthoides]
MEMEDQYGMPDLRQYRQIFTAIPPQPPPVELLTGHHHQQQQSLAQQHYEMVMMGRRGGFHNQLLGSCDASATTHQANNNNNNNNSTTSNNTTTSAVSGGGGGVGFEMETSGGDIGGGNGRWPRQETLTLLEIRSRLDSKFKEANQKGPLWDEVSRIMSEEHGYQRSGKKCREKFENLYKYYKKTKEGKAGRQDGKHYRFFRQLEALYGETSNATYNNEASNLLGTNFPYNINSIPNKITQNPNQHPFQTPRLCDSLSLSNSSGFNTSSSEDSDNDGTALVMENDSSIKKRKKRNWKAKIRDFIDGQMRKLMEKQEVWLEKMMKTIECKEQERINREEEWRKQESARIDREHTFWANERAWIEARDASLMEALHKLTGKEFKAEVRSNSGIVENGNGSEAMANVENGDRVINNNYVMKMKEGGKKRKEIVRGCYFESSGSMCNSQGGGGYGERQGEITANEEGGGNSPPRDHSNIGGSGMHDSCFRFYVGDAENLWENYGLKLNKGENQ